MTTYENYVRAEVARRLEGFDHETLSFVTCRACLRNVSGIAVFPGKRQHLVLHTLRALLIATVYGLANTEDRKLLRERAIHASETLRASQGAATSSEHGSSFTDHPVHFATTSAFRLIWRLEGTGDTSEIFTNLEGAIRFSLMRLGGYDPGSHGFNLIEKDLRYDVADLRFTPIWPNTDKPEWVTEFHIAFTDYLATEDWEFWLRWYSEVCEGTFADWDLAVAVALIPNEVWEGEEAVTKVAEAIRKIEADQLAKAVIINETLAWNDDTQVFHVEHPSVSNEQRLARHLSRVSDALDDILALGGGNGMTANTVEYRIIKRLVEKYSDDPERVAFDLTDVNKSIARQIKVGEYDDDGPIENLRASIIACVAFVCETHEEVAEELARGFEPEPQVVSEEDALVLEEAWRLSAAMLDEQAAQTTLEDKAEIMAGRIIDAAVDPMPEWSREANAMRSIVLRRQISRLWQQARGFATVPGLAEKYESQHSKALGYVARAGFGVDYLYRAITILGRWLGFG